MANKVAPEEAWQGPLQSRVSCSRVLTTKQKTVSFNSFRTLRLLMTSKVGVIVGDVQQRMQKNVKLQVRYAVPRRLYGAHSLRSFGAHGAAHCSRLHPCDVTHDAALRRSRTGSGF